MGGDGKGKGRACLVRCRGVDGKSAKGKVEVVRVEMGEGGLAVLEGSKEVRENFASLGGGSDRCVYVRAFLWGVISAVGVWAW